MKNLFNNPWVIASLGIFSIIYLVFSVGGLVLEEQAQAYVPIDVDSLDSESSSASLPQAFNIDKSNITWLDNVTRDPFGPDDSPFEVSEETSPVAEKTMHLNAIFSGETTRMAVVDQQLVREGDTIGPYRVIAIKRSQVILARDKKRLVLEALL